jgi:hypothetical protein
MRDLPPEKTGYAYFNLAQLYQQLQSIPIGASQLLSSEATILLGATRGFGATLVSDATDQLTIDLSLALQPFAAEDNAPKETPETPKSEETPDTPKAE